MFFRAEFVEIQLPSEKNWRALIVKENKRLSLKQRKPNATQKGSPFINLDDYLSKATIVDCNGRTAYEMTLLLNGEVLISGRMGSYQINPTTRETTPQGKIVPVELLEQAVAFARSCL